MKNATTAMMMRGMVAHRYVELKLDTLARPLMAEFQTVSIRATMVSLMETERGVTMAMMFPAMVVHQHARSKMVSPALGRESVVALPLSVEMEKSERAKGATTETPEMAMGARLAVR